MQLAENLIEINANIRHKNEALAKVAELLTLANKTSAEYIQGLVARETQANTYLGNGVAIPHGTPESRKYVKETAIAILQIREGIKWGENEELVYFVVGICANDDEHLAILRQLTRILNRSETLQILKNTDDKQAIINIFKEQGGDAPAPVQSASGLPFAQKISIPNPAGFHARPATNLNKLVKSLNQQIFLVKEDGTRADAKNMMKILSLGLTYGATITVESDSESALKTVIEAINSGLGDDLNPVQKDNAPAPATALWSVEGDIQKLTGICASDGLAIGKIQHFSAQTYELNSAKSALNPLAETQRLTAGLNQAQSAIQSNMEALRTKVSGKELEIFEAHLELLNDEELLSAVIEAIMAGETAENAYHQVLSVQMKTLEALPDPILSARASDLGDIRDAVIRQILGVKEQNADFPENTILCAEDLSPSDTAKLDPSKIIAFVTAKGGATSHSAILARSMGIPAVVGLKGIQQLTAGSTAIIDANAGTVYLNPTAEQLNSAEQVVQVLKQKAQEALAQCLEMGQTADGKRIEVAVNVHDAESVKSALMLGAEGVGLMRTEFLYLESQHIPSEEEQYQKYSAMAEALGDKPLIIRTLDIGGDKEVSYLNLEKEDNAFLGIRGIRLCLQRPDLFEPQVRAICRTAQKYKNIKVMFPMIATSQDWQQAQAFFNAIANEYQVKVPLGMMIEVPSSALIANQLAKEADFFSVGTNDLTQYTLAMDRMNPILAPQADALHPAVLRLIDMSVKSADAQQKWVGVCGGLAGDVYGALILVGLGVTELSVAPKEVAKVKSALRKHKFIDLAVMARQALTLSDAQEVRNLIAKFV